MLINNPAGGLRYHWRALNYSSTLWRPFRDALSGWLSEWQPPEDKIILIGPSAGYCLDQAFLSAFSQVIIVEPDPLARLLFAWRHQPKSLVALRDRFFTANEECARLEGLSSLLARFPDRAVLFCNFLGQLRLLLDDKDEVKVLNSWKKHLPQQMSGRSWASFHDRYSGPLQPMMQQPLLAPHCLEEKDCLARCYTSGGELFDHFSTGFFPTQTEHAYFKWQLTPGHWHLIEGARQRRLA